MSDYQKQLRELSKHIYIENSTRHPERSFYQPMFMEGLMEKKLATKEFLNTLRERTLSYEFLDYDKDRQILHSVPGTGRRLLLFHMLEKWWMDPMSEIPEEALLAAIRCRDMVFETCPDVPHSFRQKVQATSFLEAWENISHQEHLLLDKLVECFRRDNDPFFQMYFLGEHEDDEEKMEELPELSLYEKEGVDMEQLHHDISSGKLMYFYIQNNYDPTDRHLYTTLLHALRNHE